MTKFGVVTADPPWSFQDSLKMAATPRGAVSNYKTMSDKDIVGLSDYLKPLLADNCVLLLWVPASKLQIGLDVFTAFGGRQTQVWEWVKTKKAINIVEPEELQPDGLAFGMGRLARNCSEIALVGVKGKPYKALTSKSERNVFPHMALPHSQKPETIQDSLDRMFPKERKLELFARRQRPNWTCLGYECPGDSFGKDIRDALTLLDGEVRSV